MYQGNKPIKASNADVKTFSFRGAEGGRMTLHIDSIIKLTDVNKKIEIVEK
jgi:hypothetical protein